MKLFYSQKLSITIWASLIFWIGMIPALLLWHVPLSMTISESVKGNEVRFIYFELISLASIIPYFLIVTRLRDLVSKRFAFSLVVLLLVEIATISTTFGSGRVWDIHGYLAQMMFVLMLFMLIYAAARRVSRLRYLLIVTLVASVIVWVVTLKYALLAESVVLASNQLNWILFWYEERSNSVSRNYLAEL
jgi:hypothetical protein